MAATTLPTLDSLSAAQRSTDPDGASRLRFDTVRSACAEQVMEMTDTRDWKPRWLIRFIAFINTWLDSNPTAPKVLDLHQRITNFTQFIQKNSLSIALINLPLT